MSNLPILNRKSKMPPEERLIGLLALVFGNVLPMSSAATALDMKVSELTEILMQNPWISDRAELKMQEMKLSGDLIKYQAADLGSKMLASISKMPVEQIPLGFQMQIANMGIAATKQPAAEAEDFTSKTIFLALYDGEEVDREAVSEKTHLLVLRLGGVRPRGAKRDDLIIDVPVNASASMKGDSDE